MSIVILLEPRTPHQPGKLQKLSQNEFVFTPPIFIVNENAAPLSACDAMECSRRTGHWTGYGALPRKTCSGNRSMLGFPIFIANLALRRRWFWETR